MKGRFIMIAIIDYGAGNIQSVYKALKFIGADCKVTSDKDEILNADGAILPGVGSFGDAMDTMTKRGIKDTIIEYTKSGKPFLGICLGLQLLFPESEETPGVKGLDIFKGTITKIPNQNRTLKIPHMGWNNISIKQKNGIFKDIEGEPYVYFVHSFYLKAQDKDIVAATTQYGVEIDAAVQKGNIIATQFHPEKSGEVGLKMLKNFVEMVK
jgi:glutamine amidotransferase